MPEEPHGPEGWWTVNIGRPCAGRAVHRWHCDCGRRVPGRAARMQTCTTPARPGINQRVEVGRFSRFGSHLNGECGAPDTPASQPGFGARRGIHPGPMKDEECWRDHATGSQKRLRADAIRSPAECAPRQAFLFEKHTDDDRSCDDKGGLGYRPGLPVPSDAKEHVPDPSKSEEGKAKADDQ